MNGKKKWGIGLMAVGVIGVLVALSVELPASGGQVDERFLAALALNMALSPIVWVGLGGIFLWRSGAKQVRETASPVQLTEAPTADGSPTVLTANEKPEASPSTPTYPMPAPIKPPPSNASDESSASKWSRPDLNSPGSSPDRRSDRMGIVVAFVVLAVVAVGGWMAFNDSQVDDQVAPPDSMIVAEDPGTRTAPSTTSPATSTTATVPTETLLAMDARIRDFLIGVMALEARERPDISEFSEEASEYRDLARIWDMEYRSYAKRQDERFAQNVGHALIRRSDDYRLWDSWETSSGTMDLDDPNFLPATDARDEANDLFDYVRRNMPAQWRPSSGTAGSADDGTLFQLPELEDELRFSDLVVGDCFKIPAEGEVDGYLERTNCSGDSIEVHWVQDLSTIPNVSSGDDSIQETAEFICVQRIQERFPDVWLEGVYYRWFFPTPDQWDRGQAEAVCGYDT